MHCGIGDASGAEFEAEATGFKVQEEVILHTRRNVGHFGVVEVGKLHGNVSYIGGFESLKACKLLWWYYRTRIKWLWADICCDSLLFIDVVFFQSAGPRFCPLTIVCIGLATAYSVHVSRLLPIHCLLLRIQLGISRGGFNHLGIHTEVLLSSIAFLIKKTAICEYCYISALKW